MESGKLKVTKNGSWFIKFGRKSIPVPKEFDVDSNFAGKICEFERVDGKITKIKVDGNALEVNKEILEQKEKVKEAKIRAQKEAEEQARKERQEEKARRQERQSGRRSDRQGRSQISSVELFKLKDARVPADVRNLMLNKPVADNYLLKLQRFAQSKRDHKGKLKFIFFESNRGKITENKPDFSNIEFSKLAEKQRIAVEAVTPTKGKAVSFVADIDWKLMIGSGAPSVYETSLMLHHVYGFPYIPASSIKGAVRSYIINNFFDNDEKKAIKNALFITIFGSEDKVGQVHFVDAYPVATPNVKAEILNPHYQEYYNSNIPPTDYQSPVPVNILAVEKPKMQFCYYVKNDKIPPFSQVEIPTEGETSLATLTTKFLQLTLTDQGIGAKTSAGYGYFNIAT